MAEKEGLVESEDGHVSTMNSDPNSQNVTSDSGVSFTAFGDMLMDGGKDDSKFSFSPSHCDNKSDYASMVGLYYCVDSMFCMLDFVHLLFFFFFFFSLLYYFIFKICGVTDLEFFL
jgi:hypothetical protein